MFVVRTIMTLLFLTLIAGASRVRAQSLESPYAPRAQQLAHAQLVERLHLTRDHLRAQNHNYAVPAVGIGLGVAGLVGGAIITIAGTGGGSGYCEDAPCNAHDNYTLRRLGLTTVVIGGLLTIACPPMLVLRAVRHARLKKVERQLAWLSQHASLAPLVGSPVKGQPATRERALQLGALASFRF